MFGSIALHAQNDTISKLNQEHHLGTVNVTARKAGVMRLRGAENGITITTTELRKAACCSLGESFTTNPSVDVAYADAATGAKQIKLLGLSGTYVQMLSDNIPSYRGLAAPYSLGYVPGPWMGGIQVSKGSSSVKNGFESITGQINIGFRDCDDTDQLNANIYSSSEAKMDFNADANIHLNERLSTGLLLHYEDRFTDMDDNSDSFVDDPNVRQFNIMNRWAYKGNHYLMHAMVSALGERRRGGQMESADIKLTNPYLINIETDRYEAYLKNAYVVGNDHNTNVALMLHGSFHRQNSEWGNRLAPVYKSYDAIQRTFYASLILEHDFDHHHSLSAGLSYMRDYFNQKRNSFTLQPQSENVTGAYAQYTLNLHEKLVFMAGVRGDISSEFDGIFTPRTHLKWSPVDAFSVRLSAGKGYRTAYALAENNYLLSSGRKLTVESPLCREEAWNYGLSSTLKVPLFGRGLTVNAEFYRTDFSRQLVVDYDEAPTTISLHPLEGDSYSNTFQIDATYTLFTGMTLTCAYRLNDVKCTYRGGGLREKPLTSRYKGLLSATYRTPLGLWQFDATLQMNGGGRLPAHIDDDGKLQTDSRFSAFEQLQAQVTREFRHFSIYVGGENLTGFRQKNPIISPLNPYSDTFDPTLTWGPVKGRMFYAGIRLNFEKIEKMF